MWIILEILDFHKIHLRTCPPEARLVCSQRSRARASGNVKFEPIIASISVRDLNKRVLLGKSWASWEKLGCCTWRWWRNLNVMSRQSLWICWIWVWRCHVGFRVETTFTWSQDVPDAEGLVSALSHALIGCFKLLDCSGWPVWLYNGRFCPDRLFNDDDR